MGKVRLKITPSLASIVNVISSDWVIIEKEIGEGATIGDLLTGLALDYSDFREVVFNPDTRQVGEEVMIVLNDTLQQLSQVAEVKLNDGDTIILLPVYSGG